jgi:8-oxo-dGTP diphosphatase
MKIFLISHMSLNKNHQINPKISTDCVIFGFDNEGLQVLLIERKPVSANEEINALPGDLIYDDEDLDDAAQRVLKELTGLSDIFLEQIGAFGSPDRLSKPEDKKWLESVRQYPDERVITVAYYSLVNKNLYEPQASSFAQSAVWVPVSEVTTLAFDHFEILQAALKQLRSKIKTQPVGFNLLPAQFVLSDLHKLYEAILGRPLDKRNFRRKINKLGIVESLNKKQTGVPHKPSLIYKFNEENYQRLVEEGYDNFGF